jgi:nucleotide-binding universal stress UspA family protein
MSEHPVIACYRGLDSADAVQLGTALAAAMDEPLVLANAYRYEPVALSAQVLPADDNDRREAAAHDVLRHARSFARTDVEVSERVVASAGVAGALVGLAHELDACVLVLGRDSEGHVTRSLVPRAPCPVAVAPLGVPLPANHGFERIGIAYDGSPSAQWALVAARRLALLTDARLVVLAVGSSTQQAETWLQIARLTIGHGVRHETQALVGDAAGALSAASHDLDLLVCGSRGRSRPLATIFGSVSTHLVAHARCAMLVIPPGVGHNPRGPLGIATAA